MNQFNWDTSFQVDFDLLTGLSKTAETTKRYLSQMKDMYYDTDAVNEVLKSDDPLVYEFHELGGPERAGDLAFGTTILYPGIIGNEYFMTKGHFHTILEDVYKRQLYGSAVGAAGNHDTSIRGIFLYKRDNDDDDHASNHDGVAKVLAGHRFNGCHIRAAYRGAF